VVFLCKLDFLDSVCLGGTSGGYVTQLNGEVVVVTSLVGALTVASHRCLSTGKNPEEPLHHIDIPAKNPAVPSVRLPTMIVDVHQQHQYFDQRPLAVKGF
jgi:hypothetical protein